MRSRGELLRLSLLHKALASALEAELKSRILDAYEHERVFESVKTNYGEAYAAQTQPRGVVKDEEPFHDYLEEYTSITIRQEVRVASPSGVDSFLAESITPVVFVAEEELGKIPGHVRVFFQRPGLEPGGYREAEEEELAEPGKEFPVVDRQGRLVPGVSWFTGGTVHNVTMKGSSAASTRARRLAKQYATGEVELGDLPW